MDLIEQLKYLRTGERPIAINDASSYDMNLDRLPSKKPPAAAGKKLKFSPLTRGQCLALLDRYLDSYALWNRFWLWIDQQWQLGAPYAVLQDSADQLEATWLERFHPDGKPRAPR